MTKERAVPTAHPRSAAAVTLALLALAAPAAPARPVIDRPVDAPAEPGPAPRIQAADESFEWGSAGIGAAAAGLVLIAARRARTRLAPPRLR